MLVSLQVFQLSCPLPARIASASPSACNVFYDAGHSNLDGSGAAALGSRIGCSGARIGSSGAGHVVRHRSLFGRSDAGVGC